MTKYLSRRQDGFGYHYGFAPDDPRQINVKAESPHRWVAYVGSVRLNGYYQSVEAAERGALIWMIAHPAKEKSTSA